MKTNKSKSIIVILIILLAILIVLGGLFYAYLVTDIFKTNKELFFKYAFQMVDTENGLIDNELIGYLNEKREKPYETEGQFDVEIISEKENKNLKGANNFNITFSGQVDKKNSKAKQDIKLNYSDSINFPISYKQIEDSIGLQTKYVSNKFIAINMSKKDDNVIENLIGINENDFQNVDKIQRIINNKLSEEQKNYIKNQYTEIIDKQLGEEKFSKIEEVGSIGYKLNLTGVEFKDVIIKIIENLKEDPIILDKINESLDEDNKIVLENIDDILQRIQEYKDIDDEVLDFTVYVRDKKIVKVGLGTNDFVAALEKIAQNGKIDINLEIEFKNKDYWMNKIYFYLSFDGINSLQKVEEKYTLVLDLNSEVNGEMSYKYQFKNNIMFIDTVEIEDFSSDNSVILTNYENEKVNSFMNAIFKRISLVNKKQMEELGLEENENPIKYIIPEIETVSNSDSDNFINSLSTEDGNITKFNQKFEMYEGTNLQGTTVRGLFTTIANNNDNQNEGKKIKEINFDGDEYQATEANIASLKSTIEPEVYYKVEFEKEENTGKIYRVVINKK